MVSATCSSARWSRAHVSTSWTRSATSTAASTSRRALLVEVGPRRHAVGQRAGIEARAQQVGQAAGAAQLGDGLEHAAQLAGQRLDAGRRAGVAEDLGVGVGGAALGRVDGADAGAGLDADDGDGLARRERADVGHLGDDGELVVVGAQQDAAAASSPATALDGAAQLVGHEGERDDRPREDGGGQIGQGQPGARGRGAAGRGSARIGHASKGIDPCRVTTRS